MRITIVLALSAWIFLSSCSLALAQEDDIGQSKIYPAHPLYFLKTVRENLEIKFAGTAHIKKIRHLEFATRRLREVNSLIKNNRGDLIPATLERYWSNLGLVNNLDEKDESLTVGIINQSKRDLGLLQQMYQKVDNLKAKMFIRATINRLVQRNALFLKKMALMGKKDLITQLIPSQEKACHFLSYEASSSALNEVERTTLSERADKCHQSILDEKK